MTVEDAGTFKIKAEYDIMQRLKQLMEITGCKVTAVSLTTEEGFGIETVEITNVNIKLEIV